MSLDDFVNKKDKIVFYAGVSDIITELFYNNKQSSRVKSTKGQILHYKLGFTNDEMFCKYISLDNILEDYKGKYLKLCGVPDRIEIDNNKLYVEELKTTYYSNKDFMYNVAYAQVQLYMLISGIKDGRIYLYYKDKNKLEYFDVTYNKNDVIDILKSYLNIMKLRNGHVKH